MYIDKHLAWRMESCILYLHKEVAKLCQQGVVLDINQGAACFSGFDSYLSQVLAWGFHTQLKDIHSELKEIEGFYKRLNHPRVDLGLCSFIDPTLINFLHEKNYKLTELNQVSMLDLAKYKSKNCEENFTIRKIRAEERQEWAKVVADGFDYPPAQEQFFNYLCVPGVHAFAAYDNNQIIAGGILSVYESFGDLCVTSVPNTYRNRGIQKQLLLTRLNYAKKIGLDLAMVTTEPGSISHVNAQKMGFIGAYTRMGLSFDF